MSDHFDRADQGALGTLRIADFSRVLAGPLATMVLGDLGADVIKIEQPGVGDDTRTWGPPWWGEGETATSTYYLGFNRNKRSIALDLRQEQDLQVARQICQSADVVIDNFRTGTMERFGLDRQTLAHDHPELITCSVTGFGSTGAGADLAGYDFLIQAMSGIMHITGEVDGQPSKIGSAMVDKLTGLYAAVGILAAVEERHRTGEGQHVEVSLMQSALAGLLNVGSAHVVADVDPDRHGNRHPSIAPYEPYQAADEPVVIAAASPVLWERFCVALNQETWKTDPRFATNEARVAHVQELADEVNAVLATNTAQHWVALLQEAGIPAGPINNVRQAFEAAQALGLDPIATMIDQGAEFRSVRSPIKLSGTPPEVRRSPPINDQHGEEIRQELSESD
ncbi:MAG TPA: CoA transferase [Acidimicrobiia bacterium]|jgi:crotonobetainyl-CoA:carnitine CoA-transferase CaiB-like acyl-CoA transferase|nr:CoA transferase [Acidimicrobiia bacterium]HIL46800.1 CoA transferase [Acidimicrobiia bacterium]